MDYYSVTTSEVEWRSSICLCGMKSCRGTFLHYATQMDLQQVLNQNCGVLWRYATLLRSCSFVPLSDEDKLFLFEHGMKETVFGSCVIDRTNAKESETALGRWDWMLKYAADNLRFIEYERKALPTALMRSSNYNKVGKGFGEAQDVKAVTVNYTYQEADLEARGVMEQRIQSFVCCYSMLRRVLEADASAKQINDSWCPLRPLSVSTSIEKVWRVMNLIPKLLSKYLLGSVENSKSSTKKKSQSALVAVSSTEDAAATMTNRVQACIESIDVILKARPLPIGFTSMRTLILNIREEIRKIRHFSNDQARYSSF